MKSSKKTRLIEPSKIVSDAYVKKSENWLKGARILHNAELHENAITESYFSMYSCVMALFFKIGIKSESHILTISILNKLFGAQLSSTLSEAKKARIDTQYNVTNYLEEDSLKSIRTAEEFNSEIRIIINNIDFERIKEIRSSV